MEKHANPTVHDLAETAPEDKRGVAEALADELEFMSQTLAKLREHITENGPIELYVNGKQQCWRESPAVKAYNAMIPRYGATYKQLLSLLPAEVADEGDELDAWLLANS